MVKDHSEGLWKLPASRISTSSEEITVSPQATGTVREVRNSATRNEAALEYPMGQRRLSPLQGVGVWLLVNLAKLLKYGLTHANLILAVMV